MLKDDPNPDTPTDSDQPKPASKPDPVKTKRQAAVRARQKMRDMIRRLTASHAEYSWIYIPNSYDEQFDVICLPRDELDGAMEFLFAENDSDTSSMELDERQVEMMDALHQAGAVAQEGNQHEQYQGPAHSQARQFRVPRRRVNSSTPKKGPRKESSSIDLSKSEKRNALSPKQSEPAKAGKFSNPRKSNRSRSQNDYYAMEHKYDHL